MSKSTEKIIKQESRFFANKYHYEYEDLYQEACIVSWKCQSKFDSTKGTWEYYLRKAIRNNFIKTISNYYKLPTISLGVHDVIAPRKFAFDLIFRDEIDYEIYQYYMAGFSLNEISQKINRSYERTRIRFNNIINDLRLEYAKN